MEFFPFHCSDLPIKYSGIHLCDTPLGGYRTCGVIALMFASVWGVAAMVGVAGGSGAG